MQCKSEGTLMLSTNDGVQITLQYVELYDKIRRFNKN